MSGIAEVFIAQTTLLEVGDFFYQLVQSAGGRLTQESDCLAVAQELNLKIPVELENAAISVSPESLPPDELNAVQVLLQYPPVAEIRIFNQCFDIVQGYGPIKVSGKICVQCNASLHGISCSVTFSVRFSASF